MNRGFRARAGKGMEAGLLAGTVLLAGGCNPDLLVRVTTRVFEDGTAHRRLEVTGRNSDGTLPTDPGWMLAEAGLRLGSPGRWKRVEEGPGRLVAEGTFPAVSEIPGTIEHAREGLGEGRRKESLPDRDRMTLDREDLVVLTRWIWRERYGDPFGKKDRAAALAGLVALGSDVLRDELRRTFGSGLDSSRTDALVRGEATRLAGELLAVREKAPGAARRAERERMWRTVLARHGVPLIPETAIAAVPGDDSLAGSGPDEASSAEGPGFWEQETPLLLAWARERVAASVARPDRPVRAADLTFWPDGVEDDDALRLIAEHAMGSEDAFYEALDEHVTALQGIYGSGGARHRFEFRLTPPGTLLRTNGAPDNGTVLWLLRDEDIESRDPLLEAESYELRDEALRGLGARRDLSKRSVVAIVDLLGERDPQGDLRKLLAAAVTSGSLEPLRNPAGHPELESSNDLAARARELADLLDPAQAGPPGTAEDSEEGA